MRKEEPELTAVYLTALAIVFAASLPYLYGYRLEGTNPGHAWYSGFGFGVLDNCVYASWLQQVKDGAFFERNLFTTEAQSGLTFNVYYLAAGSLMRALGLSQRFFFQAARVGLGVALLRAVWWLISLLVTDRRARWLSFLCVGLSSGLGWLAAAFGGAWSGTDLWQPEGFTFLSLYWSPQFLTPLLLMVGVVGWLIVAERERSWRPAVYAGLCGLLLANIHGYDLVPLAASWGAFLLWRRRGDASSWSRALLAAAIASPAAAYMLYILRADPVFAKRVAVLTLSPGLHAYLLGYGLTLALAVYAAARPARSDRLLHKDARALLVAWAVMSLAVAYLPVPFQRKLIMGVHLPISILAGVAIAGLLSERKGAAWTAGALACVLALVPSNLLFLLRDAKTLKANGAPGSIRPYLRDGEVKALRWVREHGAAGAALQPIPWLAESEGGRVAVTDISLALYAPGLTGRPVHCGHMGETPDFQEKLLSWARFALPGETDASRRDWLRRSKVRYLIFSQKHDGELPIFGLFRRPPPYLRRIKEASSPDADVFEVVIEPDR